MTLNHIREADNAVDHLNEAVDDYGAPQLPPWPPPSRWRHASTLHFWKHFVIFSKTVVKSKLLELGDLLTEADLLIRGSARPKYSFLIGWPSTELKKVQGRSPNRKCRSIMFPEVRLQVTTNNQCTKTAKFSYLGGKNVPQKQYFQISVDSKSLPLIQSVPQSLPDKVLGGNVPQKAFLF